MGIWKNIGKIVILLFQIVHEQVKWYIGTWTRVKRISPKKEQKNTVIEDTRQVREIERGWYAKSNIGGAFYLLSLRN